jgi:DNA repair photolyase
MEKLTREEVLEAILALKIIEPQTPEIKKRIQKLQQQL